MNTVSATASAATVQTIPQTPNDNLPVIPQASPLAPLVPISAPVSSTEAAAMINARPLPKLAQPRKIRRHGRVASLPKLQRDMVNRMLWNGVPYKNISVAIGEAGFTITERNISNWATGGYLEWRLEQEAVLQNRLNQDHLVDFLRRDDAQELPEVGLQAAATRLSQLLLQKLAHAEDPESHIEGYTKLIDLLCRLNREIAATQKSRDDSRRSLGPEHDPARIKDVEQFDAIRYERFYSDPEEDSGLPKPAVPPLLPATPTSSILADQARQEEMDAETERVERQTELLRTALGKKAPPTAGQSSTPALLNPTTPSPRPASSPSVPEGGR